MKTNYFLSILIAFVILNTNLYAGGACSPASTNTSCAGSTSLTSGAACVNGTTCQGGTQSASSCLFAGSECSWYSFTASAASMYVNIDVTATGGCHISSNIYSGSCASLTEISCQSGAPLDDLHSLTGLTPGNTYFIQVCYSPGGPCGNNASAEYCIEVGEPTAPCNTCAAPCGTASGYPTAPTTAQVVADCQTTPFVPELQPSSTNTFCYDFTATATSVDFNVIITSNCAGGNVTNFSWSLYTSACGVPVQTGTLASLTFSPVVIGQQYVFCYTFDVPATCTHSQHCPYFVGAAPLPINLLNFTATTEDNNSVQLDWTTESEINNDFFSIERTKDGKIFEVIGIIDGAGNSSMVKNYSTIDNLPHKGISYYRLKQTDYDGNYTYSSLKSVEIKSSFDDITVFPNPINGNGSLSFSSLSEENIDINIYDLSGRLVFSKNYKSNKGSNSIIIETENLTQGMYFLSLQNKSDNSTIKFIKN